MKALLSLALLSASAFAHEGMWMPSQLPQMADTLKKAGLEIPATDLADLTKAPMNAVVSLGGCTASFVSPKGLVVTNHHCAFGSLQYNSTPQHDLTVDGFLADTMTQEKPAAPGTRIWVTESITDVTDAIDAAMATLTGKARYQAEQAKEKALVAACEASEGYRCRVFSYYGGAQYRLLKQLEIKDVRLVYAPAEAIGVFGGDIDNWMWPRQTGDFAFLRAYVSKDGKSADYSKDNVPYHPKSFLTIDGGGVAPDDFVMVAGYPGRTNRYRTSEEVKYAINHYYPAMQKYLAHTDKVIADSCKGVPDACLRYAAYQKGLLNYAKNFEGQIAGFAKSDLVTRKQAFEAKLASWVRQSPQRQSQYGQALADYNALVKKAQKQQSIDRKRGEAMSSQLYKTAYRLYKWANEQQKPDAERDEGFQNRDKDAFADSLKAMDRRFHPVVDKALWLDGLSRYKTLSKKERFAAIDQALPVEKTSELSKTLDGYYTNTTLTDSSVRLAWLNKAPADFQNSTDPFIQLAVASYGAYQAMEAAQKETEGDFMAVRPQFMQALIAYQQSEGKSLYPDANSSLRITYGHVKGYTPEKGTIKEDEDGAKYLKKGASYFTPFTTLRGIVAKSTGEVPFNAPKDELDAIADQDYGPYYVQALDSVPVNFLSTVDTTGGNSGSPTLNAKGQLVGLLFDGTFDSINSDWDFTANTRSIHLDVRYMLWVMDKLDGANNLLKEMTIVNLPSDDE
ncbi:S46 family peptidase [Gallaecimonas mangrovi]|uniref:S46 family peptidase n=1 Tax=Gallaecimonas mangrovi TaxID=2291597 RepID=UPI000E20B44F|nr:S46 family peptidase [Gallaecimonas mangrovi]